MILHIIRGLPGSGKTTFAKKLNVFHVENDMFLIKDGNYSFNFETIEKSRDWVLHMVSNAMETARVDIAVSNCFYKLSLIYPFLAIAEVHGYSVKIHECTGNFGSIHNTPKEVYDKMKKEWEVIQNKNISFFKIPL